MKSGGYCVPIKKKLPKVLCKIVAIEGINNEGKI